MHRNIKSNLDLVLSTTNMSDKIQVRVSDETWGSDHFPIFVDISIEKNHYEKKSFKLKSIRTDWSKFEENLENMYIDFLSSEYDQLSAS